MITTNSPTQASHRQQKQLRPRVQASFGQVSIISIKPRLVR